MANLGDMVEPVLKKAGKGESLSRDEFLILLLDRIFLRASNSFFKSQFSYLPRVASNLRPGKILVILLSSIGDLVYSTPVIQALREQYPDSFISFLVEEDACPVVEDNPYLDEVILLPFKDWQNKGGDPDGLLEGLRRFTLDLKERRYDYLLNLHLSPRSALIAHLTCAKYVSGFSLREDGQPLVQGNLWNLYEYLIAADPSTMKDYNRINLAERSLRMAGLDPVHREAAFFLSREKEEKVKTILDELRIDDDNLLIGLNPGSNYPARRWPLERFAGLADALIKEFGAKVIIFGGPGDVEIAREITKIMEGDALDLAGKTSLAELAGIISRCDHLITNDTGPMHISGAVRTKVIAIDGPTRFGPYGGEGHLILQANLPCVGCGGMTTCDKGDCMRAIEVSDVLAALKYQREEIPHSAFRILHSDKVNVYTSGTSPPKRLFDYYPLMTYAPGQITNDLLRFGHINLWIQENNRLGFKEEPLGLEEINRELTRRHGQEAFGESIRYVKDNIQSLRRYRESSSPDPRIDSFFGLFSILFAKIAYSDQDFQKWKLSASLFLENFLCAWVDTVKKSMQN